MGMYSPAKWLETDDLMINVNAICAVHLEEYNGDYTVEIHFHSRSPLGVDFDKEKEKAQHLFNLIKSKIKE